MGPPSKKSKSASSEVDLLVLDLLRKQTEQNKEKYKRLGASGFSMQQKRIEPNKRFLKNILSSVESHNQRQGNSINKKTEINLSTDDSNTTTNATSSYLVPSSPSSSSNISTTDHEPASSHQRNQNRPNRTNEPSRRLLQNALSLTLSSNQKSSLGKPKKQN